VAKSLHKTAQSLLSPTLKRRGFAISQVLNNWPEIIGQRYAEIVKPVTIKWHYHTDYNSDNAEQSSYGILHIACPAVLAPEIQHKNHEIVAKVNAAFGYQAISSIRIKHIALTPKKKKRRQFSNAQPKMRIQLDKDLNPRVKDALERLGGAMKENKK